MQSKAARFNFVATGGVDYPLPKQDAPVGAIDERTKKAMHILRNPFGWDTEERRRAAYDACQAIERLAAAYENMRQFAEANGLDTTCHMPPNAEAKGD